MVATGPPAPRTLPGALHRGRVMRITCAAVACALASAAAVPNARADTAPSGTDAEQIQALKKQIAELTARLDAMAARPAVPAAAPAPDAAAAARLAPVPAVAQEGSAEGSTASGPARAAKPQAQTAGGGVAGKLKGLVDFYGHLDLSVDLATKGLSGR